MTAAAGLSAFALRELHHNLYALSEWLRCLLSRTREEERSMIMPETPSLYQQVYDKGTWPLFGYPFTAARGATTGSHDSVCGGARINPRATLRS